MTAKVEKNQASTLVFLTHSLSSPPPPPLLLPPASLDTTRGPAILAASTVPRARARNSPPTAALAASEEEEEEEVEDIRSFSLSLCRSLSVCRLSVPCCSVRARASLALDTGTRRRETERESRGRGSSVLCFLSISRRQSVSVSRSFFFRPGLHSRRARAPRSLSRFLSLSLLLRSRFALSLPPSTSRLVSAASGNTAREAPLTSHRCQRQRRESGEPRRREKEEPRKRNRDPSQKKKTSRQSISSPFARRDGAHVGRRRDGQPGAAERDEASLRPGGQRKGLEEGPRASACRKEKKKDDGFD